MFRIVLRWGNNHALVVITRYSGDFQWLQCYTNVIIHIFDIYLLTTPSSVYCLLKGFCCWHLNVARQYSGVMVNHVDIAPPFAGTLFGLSNTSATLSGIFAPYVVAVLTPYVSMTHVRFVVQSVCLLNMCGFYRRLSSYVFRVRFRISTPLLEVTFWGDSVYTYTWWKSA